MAKIQKRGPGGLVESIGKKAVRGFLKEATEGKPVTKVPASKYNRARDQEERAYEKGHGFTKEEMAESRAERMERGELGDYSKESHGISPDQMDELDDLNTKMEVRRKIKAETKPTPIRGQDSNLEREISEQGLKGKYGQYKKGGKIELGRVAGAKGKRRMDKKARR